MTIDAALFRQALSYFASGVTIVTTFYENTPYGLTVSSFTSVSLEPRLVLVCLDKHTRNYTALTASGVVGINILAANQQQLSQHFAGRNKDDWSAIEYSPGTHQVPLLTGALVQLECRVAELLPGGDHTIVVGEILEAHIPAEQTAPLLYYRGAYQQLAAQTD